MLQSLYPWMNQPDCIWAAACPCGALRRDGEDGWLAGILKGVGMDSPPTKDAADALMPVFGFLQGPNPLVSGCTS